MSIALFALADATVAESKPKDPAKKAPPKRTLTPIADRIAAPEPR